MIKVTLCVIKPEHLELLSMLRLLPKRIVRKKIMIILHCLFVLRDLIIGFSVNCAIIVKLLEMLGVPHCAYNYDVRIIRQI